MRWSVLFVTVRNAGVEILNKKESLASSQSITDRSTRLDLRLRRMHRVVPKRSCLPVKLPVCEAVRPMFTSQVHMSISRYVMCPRGGSPVCSWNTPHH